MCPLSLREHCGLVQVITWKNLKGRDQPVRCSSCRNEEEVAMLIDSHSSVCWAKNTESICCGPGVGCARKNWPGVWVSEYYQGLFLLSPFLRVVFCVCVFSLFINRPSLCNYKMDIRSSWVNPLLASKPGQQSKSLYPTVFPLVYLVLFIF